jgi:hypothetical protein
MKRRWMVVGLALVAVVGIAVPASGAGSTVLQALGLAKSANKNADDARRFALDARHRARLAQSDALRAIRIARGVHGDKGDQGPPGATGAQGASGSQGQQGPAGLPGQPPKLKFASVAGSFSTSSTSYIDGGGPEATVDVPDSGGGTGFIEVWAQATGHGGDPNEGSMAVGLFDVTGGGNAFVAGQDQLCTMFNGLPGELLTTSASTPGPFGTPTAFGPDNCAALGPPGPVLLSAPTGQRTFQLKYAFCGCPGDTQATVDSRNLWIAPRPTD